MPKNIFLYDLIGCLVCMGVDKGGDDLIPPFESNPRYNGIVMPELPSPYAYLHDSDDSVITIVYESATRRSPANLPTLEDHLFCILSALSNKPEPQPEPTFRYDDQGRITRVISNSQNNCLFDYSTVPTTNAKPLPRRRDKGTKFSPFLSVKTRRKPR